MKQTRTQGFAMLFTVLVMTLILSIALGIANITFKQTILSSLAKDSQVAFYQADAGIECVLYYDLDITKQYFDGVKNISELECGNQRLTGGMTSSNYYAYVNANPGAGACINTVIIDKTGSQVDIISRGNNVCQTNPRQVERALEVKYNQ
jgi:hypothetical protein